MYEGVAHQNSLNMGSNSDVYNKAAIESQRSFQRSGEPFEMLDLHVNSVYIFEMKKAIMVMFYSFLSSAER